MEDASDSEAGIFSLVQYFITQLEVTAELGREEASVEEQRRREQRAHLTQCIYWLAQELTNSQLLKNRQLVVDYY